MSWSWKTLFFILTLLSFTSRTWSNCLDTVYESGFLWADYKYTCTNMSLEQYQVAINNFVRVVRQLELIQINVPTIDQHVFYKQQYEKVYFLTIEKCGVTTIEEHSFDKFTSLKHLYIFDNNIKYVSSQFVQHLPNLNLLDLSNNSMQQLNIDCDHHQGFLNLILNTNFFTTLQKDSFKNCEFLNELKIRNSNVAEIQKETFLGLDSLSSLDLSNNPITRIEPGAFSGLTRVSEINLTDIFSNIKELKSGMFLGLESVQGINFSNLNIQSLEGHTFQGLNSLEYLDLDNNKISVLRAWTFEDLPRLKFLSLENNPISKVEPHGFVNIPDCKIIDFHKMSHHMTHIQQGFFDGIHNERIMNLTGLNIYTIQPKAFEDINFLESLLLNNNKLETLDAYQFSNIDKLQSLTLAHNPINFINPTAFFNLTNLRYLNLSSTNLSFIETFTFDSLLSLNILDLSFCKLKNLEVELFCNDELYLNNNQIEYIGIRAFQNLTSLNRLYLQFNKISHLEIMTFSALEQLRYLDISHNKLNALSESILHPLKSLRRIYLPENPWSCPNLTSIREYCRLHGIVCRSKIENFSVSNVDGIECNEDQIVIATELEDKNMKNESNKRVEIILNDIKNDSNKIMIEISKSNDILLNGSNNIMGEICNTTLCSPNIILYANSFILQEIFYVLLIFVIGYFILKISSFIYKIYENYTRICPLHQDPGTRTEMDLYKKPTNVVFCKK